MLNTSKNRIDQIKEEVAWKISEASLKEQERLRELEVRENDRKNYKYQ